MFVYVGGDWRDRFENAWQAPDPEPDEGPGLTWRQLTPRHWSGTWESNIRGTVTRDGDGWVAYFRLGDLPGLSPIATVGRFSTVDAAMAAPTRCGRPGNGGRVRRELYVSGSDR